MRRPIHCPRAERTHLLLAYQSALAEHQALVVREQQVLEELEAREINVEANTIAHDAFLCDCVKTDTGGDGGSALTTQYGGAAQMEAGSVERHVLRMALGLIAGGMLSVKDEQPLHVDAARMRDAEPLLYMVKIILGCEPEMQRLKREAEQLQQDIEGYLAARDFEYLSLTVDVDGEEERAAEYMERKGGRAMGSGELVHLEQWPLPPRRREWVLHGERIMENNTQARR